MPIRRLLLLAVVALLLGGCGYNDIQVNDERTKATWAEVINQYKRRADLIPNLVKTVEGYAVHEKSVLTDVTEARARVGSVLAGPELQQDPKALASFQAAQGQLSSALSRLLVVVERYPELKADASFRDLQAQLEGTENRIAVARNRYIRAVENYNVSVRTFPNNLLAMTLGYDAKPNFAVDEEAAISAPPGVEFGTRPAR
ncbi:MAG: LemA family protein [Rhodocyclaceae bacterium]|nr:LemA family protein [Rhodocyclaceae bacterium]